MSERVGSAADAELVELLERRASRAKVDRGLVERVVAAVATERQARPSPFGRVALSAERARLAVGAVAIVAAVVSLVGAALFVGAGAAKKADEPSASPSPAQQTATRFTSVDFLRFLHEQPDAFIGHTVLVDGTLNEDLLYQCPAVGCPRHFGGSSTGDPAVVPIDAQAAASIGSTPSGTFAIQVHSASDVRLVGRVQAPPTGEFWQPHALRGRPATGSDVYLVDGYFGGVSGMGCDLVLVVPTWCPTTWISDTPDETATSDDGIPATALRVPADIPRSRGVPALHPHVKILVRPAPEGTCAANPTCQASDPENLWLVAATVEPVTLDVRSSPEPSSVADAEPPVIDQSSVADLLPTLKVGTTILVKGTIEPRKCDGPEGDCPMGQLAGAQPIPVFNRGDGTAPPVAGTFALTVEPARSLGYLETIVPNGDDVSWRPLELASYGPPRGTAYVVSGWLVPAEGAAACPGGPSQPTLAICSGRPPQLVEDEATARAVLSGQKVDSLLLRDVAASTQYATAEAGTYIVRASTTSPCPATKSFGPGGVVSETIPDCFVPSNQAVGLYVDGRVDSVDASDASPSVTAAPSPAPAASEASAITILPPVADPFVGPGNEFVNDAVAYGDGFVAVGYLYSLPDGHRSGNVWLSPDGLAWKKLTPPELHGVAVDHVAASGRRLLLHGVSGRTETDPGEGRVFASDDGRTWTEVTPSALRSDPEAALVAGPTGFLALTHVGAGLHWQAWISGDGAAWRDTALPAATQGSVVTLSGWEQGYALAITEGSELNNPWPTVRDRHAEVAVSTDGATWRIAPLPDATGAGRVFGTSKALIAVGGEGYCSSCISQPSVWRSGDEGATWAKVDGMMTVQDALVTGRDRLFIWSIDSRGRPFRLRESDDAESWREIAVFEVRPVATRDAVGEISGVVGSGGFLGFDQTNAAPAHQVAVFARFGPPPAGAAPVSPAPEPSDQPCRSADVGPDGACGP